jgi:hypothetical protein
VDPRALWKRALLAALAYSALLLAWPAVQPLYAPAFRTLAERAVGFVDPLPGPIDARFEPESGGILAVGLERMDTAVYLRHRELGGADGSFGASSYFHAYVPTAVLLALFVAATPLAWRVRRRRLAWALALLHVFIVLRCAVAAFYCLSKCHVDGVPVVELGPAGKRLLHLTWHFTFGETLANYLVPILVWALCVFGPRPGGEPGA